MMVRALVALMVTLVRHGMFVIDVRRIRVSGTPCGHAAMLPPRDPR